MLMGQLKEYQPSKTTEKRGSKALKLKSKTYYVLDWHGRMKVLE